MRFGFLSTRFHGTDGVSLESSKWAEVLQEDGHDIFWFSGLSDRDPGSTALVPKAHFEDPEIARLHESIWGKEEFSEDLIAGVDRLRRALRGEILDFISHFEVDVLVPQNALTIPMNIPLGLAISDVIEKTDIPTIAHHHDFYWERDRFTGNAVQRWLDEAFPPSHPSISHVVINTAAQRDLKERCGIRSTVIPNVMDFEKPAPQPAYSKEKIWEMIGLDPTDRMILQPTRIIPRKGIELSIELLSRLNNPHLKLVISHDSGDEGHEYLEVLRKLATKKGVGLVLIGHLVQSEASASGRPGALFSLADLYPHADFVTFPSLYEGFGNALLEAIYFGKPLLVNRYSVFREDIEPTGLDLVCIDGSITENTVREVASILTTPPNPDKNRKIAADHFGYRVLRERLSGLLQEKNGQSHSGTSPSTSSTGA